MTQGQGARPLAVAAAGRWRVDPSASSCSFLVRDKLVTTVRGSMPVVDGQATVGHNGTVDTAYVEVSVEGIATGNDHRDKDLRKPAFLDAAAHPRVRVGLTEKMAPEGNWSAGAVVQARGATAPMTLAAEVVECSALEIRLHVRGRLDRRPLGIKAPSFLVGRFVELEADLTFRLLPADPTDH